MYKLDSPLYLLDHPPIKSSYKYFMKKMVRAHWKDILQTEASHLPSLCYFDARNCNFGMVHPIFSLAGDNCFEVHKATVVARMISGRYRTDYLARHWNSRDTGACKVCNRGETGDLLHLVTRCAQLRSIKNKMNTLATDKSSALLPLRQLLYRLMHQSNDGHLLHFLLEPSVVADMVALRPQN